MWLRHIKVTDADIIFLKAVCLTVLPFLEWLCQLRDNINNSILKIHLYKENQQNVLTNSLYSTTRGENFSQ
jgi:hypothetical protein